MNWKKRVREIAERNPNALHPIFRGVRPANSGKVWDRVEWQTKGEGNIQAEDAARPIRLVLAWLHRRNLLTEPGKRMVSAPAERLALTSALLLPKAVQFLDAHYERWHAGYGINLIMEASAASSAEQALEYLWLHGDGK